MRRFLIVVAACGLLAGCETKPRQPDWAWAREGSSQADFDRDDAACTAQAFQGGANNLFSVAIVKVNCMRSKGWQQVPRSR